MQSIYKSDYTHCAFTDLIKFEDWYYLAFRVGEKHEFSNGYIKIMRSSDGKKWEHWSETQEMYDIRDPRFYIDLTGRLMLLVNRQYIEKGKVYSQRILWGRVCENYIMLDMSYFGEGFVSFVKENWLMVYDAVKGNYVKHYTDTEKSVIKIEIPGFSDSTEATTYKGKYFVRRDFHESYWVKDNKIIHTNKHIHCPYIFDDYLLGRETDPFIDRSDWDNWCKNKSKLKLWKIKKDLSLKFIKQFDAWGDCGYFGYANGLVSYYSNYDKKNPKSMAICVEEVNV